MDEKDFEIAAQLELLERESSIAKVRMKVRTGPPPDNFEGDCLECGSDIPDARIAHGYYVCVDCVAEAEHRQKLGVG